VRAQIKEKGEVAKGTLLVIFDLLDWEVDFKPGQYFWVTLLTRRMRTTGGRAGTSPSSPRRTSAVCSVSARACATACMSTVSLPPFLGV
jgi:NAD(P)H-flavin reductase